MIPRLGDGNVLPSGHLSNAVDRGLENDSPFRGRKHAPDASAIISAPSSLENDSPFRGRKLTSFLNSLGVGIGIV